MTKLNFCPLIMRTAGKDVTTGGLRIVFGETLCVIWGLFCRPT